MPTPLVNVVTLGAMDTERLRDFYVALGWPLVEDGELKVFELRGGVLSIFPVDQLAHDANSTSSTGDPGIGCSMEVLVDSGEEVDALAGRVEAAGGRITKPPADAEFFEGRSCYFADPEDNYFEIAWAPADNLIVAAARRAAAAAQDS